MKKNVWRMLDSYLCMQDDLRKSGILSVKTVHKGDKIAERMLLEFAKSGCPIFRATTPLSRGQLKSKGRGKLSIHYAALQETIDTIFSHNCFCKPAQSLRSSRRDV